MAWPKTKEEIRAITLEMYGPPELYTEEVKAWVREKAELVRTSVVEGETLLRCYKRMLKEMRAEAEHRFPGCGAAWRDISDELGFYYVWPIEEHEARETEANLAKFGLRQDPDILKKWVLAKVELIKSSQQEGETYRQVLARLEGPLRQEAKVKFQGHAWGWIIHLFSGHFPTETWKLPTVADIEMEEPL